MRQRQLTGEGVVTLSDETYLSVERAAEYLGRKRATVFNYIKRFDLPTRTFTAQYGKRKFLKRSDLDKVLAGELEASPKAEAVA